MKTPQVLVAPDSPLLPTPPPPRIIGVGPFCCLMAQELFSSPEILPPPQLLLGEMIWVGEVAYHRYILFFGAILVCGKSLQGWLRPCWNIL